MKTIEDMQTFTLEPGETLILRYRRPVPLARQMIDSETIRKAFPNNTVVVLEHDIDVMAGRIEVIEPKVEVEPEVDWKEVEKRYDQGHIVQCKQRPGTAVATTEFLVSLDGWIDIHRYYNRHTFDPAKFEYRLAPPKVPG